MLKKRGFWSAVLGLGVTTTMLLSACGSTSSATTGGTFGGSIVDAVSQEAASVMPQQSSQAFAAIVMSSLWAPLAYADNKSPAGIHAGLLTEVPTVANGDIVVNGTTSETIKLKLRPNLKWSDGKPLTSADVAFTIKTLSDPKYGSSNGFQNSEIASTATPDGQTTVITLNTVDVTFLLTSLVDDAAFTVLPEHHYSSMAADAISADFNPSVVSGPFTLVERVKGDHITVKKNPDYYQAPKPYLNQITFKYFPDATTEVTAFQAGQVDTGYFLPAEDKPTLQAIPGYTLYQPKSPGGFEAFYFNLSNPILKDIKVREALAIGFDIKVEISQVQKGAALPQCDDGIGTFADDPSLIGSNGYCTYGPDAVSGFDQTKAGSLLDAAGWNGPKTSDGYRTNSAGQTLELKISTTSGRAYRLQSEQLAQAAWKQIGVKIDIENHPSSVFFTTFLGPTDKQYLTGNPQWAIAEYQNSTTDPDDHTVWSSDQLAPQGGSNWTYLNDPALDALEKTQATQFDQAARTSTMHQIYQTLLKDMPLEFLYGAIDYSEFKSSIQNYAPSSVGGIEAWNVWDWYIKK